MADERNTPATKGDLLDLEERLTESMRASQTELERRLTESMRASQAEFEERLTESMRDIQTELLKAFYGFTQTVQVRFQEQDQSDLSLKRRLSVVEDRILEIEKRLNFPPSAA